MMDFILQHPILVNAWLVFKTRTLREKVLLCCAAVLVLYVGVTYGVLKPLESSKNQAVTRLNQAQEQYQLLLANAEKLRSERTVEAQLIDRNTDELRRLLSQTSSEVKLVADRVWVESEGRIQILAQNAPFSVVSAWLNVLARERVTITDFQIQRVSDGRVYLNIILD